ncbi:AAA family ATPase [Terrabacter sp. 2RAF25]|uniref:AAA family ATPase n=1 Tax=Terrabacter sp. 2RAF25 TaxID=3232998 RepID=UPI003F979531
MGATAGTDIEVFADAAFAEGEGYAHLALGRAPRLVDGKYEYASFEPRSFQWPAEREELVSFVRQASCDGDVFMCPYLMRGRERRRGQSVARWCVHADVDGDPTASVIQVARDLGGFVIASGSRDSYHLYVPLDRSVAVEEHRALCVALRDRLGGDDKIADNDLLRPPGTLNHKARVRQAASPAGVQFAIRPSASGLRSTPEAVAEYLRVDLPLVSKRVRQRAVTGAGRSEPPLSQSLVGDGSIPVTVRDAVGDDTGDRSVDTMRIVAAAHDEGLQLSDVVDLIERHRPDLQERLHARGDDDLAVCWGKIVEDRATTKTSERQSPRRVQPLRRAGADRDRRPIQALPLAALLDSTVGDREWVVEGFIPAGAAVSLVAKAGAGKSLLALAVALAVARGDESFAGMPIPRPRRVMYADMENTSVDLRERLLALGVNPGNVATLDDLHLLLLPDLWDLDTEAGAAHLTTALDMFGLEEGDVVVLDSFQRVIEGAENDADTIRRFYRHTGRELKRRGLTVLRTDNTGKDAGKGARGSAGKRDDVDLEYHLSATPTTVELKVEKSRIAGVSTIKVGRDHDQLNGYLRYHSLSANRDDMARDLVELMNELGVPADHGEDRVKTFLAQHDQHPSRAVLRKALRLRKR